MHDGIEYNIYLWNECLFICNKDDFGQNSYDINSIAICMLELIDVELHEQSNQIRIVLYERKQFGSNKFHYTKNNWCPKLFNFVPLESDSPFKFGTLWFTTKTQWLNEFQSLLVQDFCLGRRINLAHRIIVIRQNQIVLE